MSRGRAMALMFPTHKSRFRSVSNRNTKYIATTTWGPCERQKIDLNQEKTNERRRHFLGYENYITRSRLSSMC